jgi:hypothetical protein
VDRPAERPGGHVPAGVTKTTEAQSMIFFWARWRLKRSQKGNTASISLFLFCYFASGLCNWWLCLWCFSGPVSRGSIRCVCGRWSRRVCVECSWYLNGKLVDMLSFH